MLTEKSFMDFAFPFIRIGQIFGLCPFDMQNGKAIISNEKRFAIISISYCLLHLLHLLHSLWYLNYWLLPTVIFIRYVDIVWTLFARCQVYAMLIECFFKRKTHVDIINSINFLNEILTKNLKIKNINKMKLKKIVWILFVSLLSKLLLAVIIFLVRPTWARKYYNMLFTVSHILKFFYSTLLLVYIYSLLYNIQMMNYRLNTIRCDNLFGENENKFNSEINYFIKCFTMIWKITKLIDHWIFWSMLIGFTYSLLCVVGTLYWIFVYFFQPEALDGVSFSSAVVVFINTSIDIVQLCDACNRVANAIKEMKFNLNCIEVKRKRTRNISKQFFLQVFHQQIYFSIFKCLKIDFTLLFIVS